MDINSAISFVNAFDKSRVSRCYLARSADGRFQVVNKKTDKNLNTHKIADIASGCMQVIANSRAISGSEQKHLMQKLKLNINSYSNRVYRSKPWWAKILAFFGCLSKGEKLLKKTAAAVTNFLHKRNPYKKEKNDLFRRAESNISVGMERQDSAEMLQLRRFYAKVLETSGLSCKQLEGYIQPAAIRSYLDDLKLYARKFKEIPGILQNTMSELKRTYKISLLSTGANMINDSYARRTYSPMLADELNRKLKKLPVSTKENPAYLVLPGGYVNHAVLYRVEKQANGNFSLTIINTGGGSDISLLNSVWTLIRYDRLTVQDVRFSEITSQQLSTDFLVDLLNTGRFSSMDDVEEMIKQRIPSTNRTTTHKHKGQRKGTCAFKSVSAFLHQRLGDKLYNNFKFFSSKHELDDLVKRQSSSRMRHQDQKIFSQFIEEGRTIIKRRQKKVCTEYPC